MAELEDLVVSGTELDKKLVAETLMPYLQLDKDSCDIRPTEEWEELSQEQKIVAYLLARKAMVALRFELTAEAAKASEVVQATGLKSGTVYPALRSLLANRIINQSQDRRYFVPSYA
ncbi:MAG: hypothetical protein H8E40_09585, partial [Chloroflexi bacterium]|nr:hypothetical protein [Chloroflexota bacterium]